MKKLIPTLAALAALSGCDVESWHATPEQYEQAKLDCAPHGGLMSVEQVHVFIRPNRVDAVCKGGPRISREI